MDTLEPPDFSRPVHCLLGLPFDAIDLPVATKKVRSAASSRTPLFISTPNLNFLVACQSDSSFRNSVICSDLSLADGMPIIWFARLLGAPIRERVAGASLFESLRDSTIGPEENPLSVFFFGGPNGVAQTACERLNDSAMTTKSNSSGGLRCVGYESPGFGTVEEMSSAATIAHLNDSHADFVVVSLGARKGQEWIEYNRKRLNAPIISHLGAVVNMVAGTVQRAPRWMQKIGLEWVWRIKEEPTLWRRYFDDGKALLRLLLTRALPLAWMIRVHQPNLNQLSNSTFTVSKAEGCTRVNLSGVWVTQNLPPVRMALSQAISEHQDIELNLSNLTYADSAFLGMLLIMYGHQISNGRRLTIPFISQNARRLFHYSCLDFLLAPEGP